MPTAPPPSFDRRSFLRFTAVVAAGPVAACGDDGGSLPTDRTVFPQSVASGDPRPDGVVLWTRALDPARPGDDFTVSLEVATDAGFRRLVTRVEGLAAPAAHDHVVKVKVTGLRPRTGYFYRFRALREGAAVASPVGRTRTAPAPDQAVKIRLAFASCQDYRGRYYNSWQQLIDRNEDLDIVLFLGDYVYETVAGSGAGAATGGSGAEPDPASRRIGFSDPGSALAQGSGLAAQSLSNYRDLYRAVRSDPILQQVHERYPFVIIWDDHEFSNDCWGAHATYLSGAVEELQTERRRNAEQVFFEYLPIEAPADSPQGAIDPGTVPLFPEGRIYRELTFGTYLRLLLTDFRSYRPDHLVPEEAYPGTPFLTAAELEAMAAAGLVPPAWRERVAAADFALVDVSDPANEAVRAELVAAATEEAMRAGVAAAEVAARVAAVVQGPLALAHVNAILTARGKPSLAPAPSAAEGPRGLAFVHLGKRTWFSAVGSRFVLVEEVFAAYAAALFARSGGASEGALGEAQEQWLAAALERARPEGWTVVASSVSMSTLVLDLAARPGVPPDLQSRFLFTADQWDGFPRKKAELLARMAASSGGRTLVVAGDIHAAYASVEGGVPCLTAPAISSSTASEVAASAVAGYGLDPTNPAVALLIAALDGLFKEANPGMVLSDTTAHGLVVLEVAADAALATFYLVPAMEARTSYAGRSADLRRLTRTLQFRIEPGRITALPSPPPPPPPRRRPGAA